MQEIITTEDIVDIVKTTLDFLDERITGHGERVASLAVQIVRYMAPNTSEEKLRDLLIAGILHDIGAYKTEEIDNMVQFEAHNVWAHAIYGALYIKHLSPFPKLTNYILYHHLPFNRFEEEGLTEEEKLFCGALHIADRLDIYLRYTDEAHALRLLHKNENLVFCPKGIEAVTQLAKDSSILTEIKNDVIHVSYKDLLSGVQISEEMKHKALEMVAYAIDFRSEHTVRHTITTVSVAYVLATRLLDDIDDITNVYYGALLHDVGKIATPVEILEKPGKLTAEEWEEMKMHVYYSEQILAPYVKTPILLNAIRHHEKPDGSGYHYGLKGDSLTLSKRIIALADIVSALSGERSYKKVFTKEKIISILLEDAANNRQCPTCVNCFVDNYDSVMAVAHAHGDKQEKIYADIKTEFTALYDRLSEYRL